MASGRAMVALVLTVSGPLALADRGGTSVVAEAEWPRVCPGERVCFRHPPGLQPVPLQPIDSLAGRYQGQGLTLSYDLGRHASDFSELASPRMQAVQVDGRRGDVLVSGPVMALRIPRVREGVRFAMALRFTGVPDQALGRRIFQSIEFRLPHQ